MKFIKRFSKSVPMALCGLSLGLAALGNLLNHPFSPFRRRIVETAYPAIEWLYNPELATTLRYICGWLSLIVLLVFAMKLIFDFPHAREELKTPVPLSVLPTATMAVMLLSTYLIGHLPNIIVAIIWAAAFVTQIGIMAVFFCRFIPKFKLGTVFPSWFIILVGMATASVTAPAINGVTGDWINIVSIGQAVFYITLVLYLIGLPIVITRMIKVRIFPEPAKKTIAIFAAPMGLSIVGFYSSFVAPTVPATPA
ncbi:MAG: hypothetical protein FWB93_00845, partial [Oscillospiraceae bacterium]|nr:hypothetical protein [Oscillospiraceae bacterium]